LEGPKFSNEKLEWVHTITEIEQTTEQHHKWNLPTIDKKGDVAWDANSSGF